MADPGDDGDAAEGLTPEEASDHVIGHVTAFVRELRAEGADVPANAGIDATGRSGPSASSTVSGRRPPSGRPSSPASRTSRYSIGCSPPFGNGSSSGSRSRVTANR